MLVCMCIEQLSAESETIATTLNCRQLEATCLTIEK